MNELLLKDIDYYIKKNIKKGTRVYVGQIAKKYYVDYAELTKSFKEYKKIEMEAYIRNLEIEKILKLWTKINSIEYILEKSVVKNKDDLDKLFLEYKKCTFKAYIFKLRKEHEYRKYKPSFNKINAHIEKHYCKYNYQIKDISKSTKLSKTLINSIWNKFSDEQIMNKVYRLKTDKAKELLQEGYTSNEVAQKVGIKNTKSYPYFSRFFKKVTGESITKYLQNYNLNQQIKEKYKL